MSMIGQTRILFESNATLLLVGSLLVVTIGGIVEIAPLFYLENTIEKVEGMRPYSPLRARRTQHLHPRRLLCLPQPDDPAVPRRGRALRPLQPRRGIDVRPSVPVGIEADRTGPRPRRRPLLQRVARPAPDRAALGRAGIDHAELRVPRRHAAAGREASRRISSPMRASACPTPTR